MNTNGKPVTIADRHAAEALAEQILDPRRLFPLVVVTTPAGRTDPYVPAAELIDAISHRADVVALSFSIAFPQRQIGGLLEQLRLMLPAEVELWAGGRGIARQSPLPGTTLIATLDEAIAAVSDWRAAHA